MHLILETQLPAQGPLVEIHSDPGVYLSLSRGLGWGFEA